MPKKVELAPNLMKLARKGASKAFLVLKQSIEMLRKGIHALISD
jgi:hypothetical protein